LLIRTALIVLLVIAVAGPFVERLGGDAAAGEPVLRVLVLDGSYSMAYKPGEQTRFDTAKDVARDLVARSAQGDGFALVLMSDPARTIVGTPAFVSDETRDALRRLKSPSAADLSAAQRAVDEDSFLRELRDVKLPQGGGDLAGALDRVEEIVARARQQNPRLATAQVYFLTDLGRTSWDLAAVASGPRIREQLARLAAAARLSVVDLGQEHCENLAVTDLQAVQPICITHAPVDLRAEVRNFGGQTQKCSVELLIDGQRVQEQSIELAAHAKQSVPFAYRFAAPGEHAVEAQLVGDAADALEIDNHRWLVVAVKDSVEVLVVNGDGARQNARFLTAALDPYGDGSEPMPVRVQVVAAGSLLEQDLRHFDCIFLENVAQFAPGEPAALAGYVRGGGGLVFFLGERVDAERYNQQLGGRSGQPRLLPALLDRPAPSGKHKINPLGFADPIVADFKGNAAAGQGLLSTIVTRYFQLKKIDAAVAAHGSASSPPVPSAARVALAVGDHGDPLIIAEGISGLADSAARDETAATTNPTGPQKAGKDQSKKENSNEMQRSGDNKITSSEPGGRSIIVAIPASFASVDPSTGEPWTNWPLKASFQPMVQNLLLAAIGPQAADRNLLVGQPLDARLPASGGAAGIVLQRPDGRKESIRIANRGDDSRWSYADTWQSGLYRTEFPASNMASRLYAVNVDTAESDLAKTDASELPGQLIVLPGLAEDSQRPAAALAVRSGWESYFLFAALGLLLMETVLAWWFGARSA